MKGLRNLRGTRYYLCNMYRCAVAVVNPQSVEHPGHGAGVLQHMVPQVRAILWLVSVPQLDRVAPDDQLTAQVHLGPGLGEVLQRICVHDPAVANLEKGGPVAVHKGLLRLGVRWGPRMDEVSGFFFSKQRCSFSKVQSYNSFQCKLHRGHMLASKSVWWHFFSSFIWVIHFFFSLVLYWEQQDAITLYKFVASCCTEHGLGWVLFLWENRNNFLY